MTHAPTIEKLSRYAAIAEGVLVTLILGSTLVFNKMALNYMGPLTITGLRYFLAFLLLLPFMLRRRSATHFSFHMWIHFLLLGISFYAIGNGAIVWGLKYIPATTGSLLLSLVPLIVLLVGILWLKEIPTRLQIAGIGISLVGSALFFSLGFKAGEPLGISIVAVGLIGSASLGLFGRALTRQRLVDTISLTAIPLVIGSGILLPLAFFWKLKALASKSKRVRKYTRDELMALLTSAGFDVVEERIYPGTIALMGQAQGR